MGSVSSIIALTSVFFMSSAAQANVAKVNADELYSESIYIQKSSAEVPGSLESSGKDASQGEMIADASDTSGAIESVEDLENSPAPKKVSSKRAKKSLH